MYVLDTNYLIAGLREGSPQQRQIEDWLGAEQPVITTVVAWAEFLCGPVDDDDITMAQAMLPDVERLELADAPLAADLFNAGGRRRNSLRDCLIAATTLRCGGVLATLNMADFARFESHGLKLWRPPTHRVTQR